MNRRAVRIAGLGAALSAAFWMITGMGWWTPIDFEHGVGAARGFVIAITHFVLIMAAVISHVEHP